MSHNLVDKCDYFLSSVVTLLPLLCFSDTLTSFVHGFLRYSLAVTLNLFFFLVNHCNQNMGFGLLKLCLYFLRALESQLLSSYSLLKRKMLQLVPETSIPVSQ